MLHAFLLAVDFFKNISGIPSEFKTVLIRNLGPDLGQNCLQKLSADGTNRKS